MKLKTTFIAVAALTNVVLISLLLTVLFPSAVAAKDEEITYTWLACGGILTGGTSCPNTTFASNGHKIEITGEGELTDHVKAVTGEGTFVHSDADGNVLASGTWVATELLNFKTYGPGDPALVPADWRTGMARMRVDLMIGGEKVAEGILSVGCRLPGAKLPPSVFEGINLNVLGGLNFNKVQTEGEMPPGGVTLFIEQ